MSVSFQIPRMKTFGFSVNNTPHAMKSHGPNVDKIERDDMTASNKN
jgi:hypothetical protein